MTPRSISLRVFRDESGWALMDAVWSSVIVVMAFAASTAVFNQSARTSARETKNTQALVVAQGQLNWLRSRADQDQDYVLNSVNNTTVTVNYRGTAFTVRRTAVPSTGLGEGGVEACSVDRGSASDSESIPDSRPYIYLRVVVTYPGQIVKSGPTGTGFNATEPIALDSNYAAEGGTQDLTTGMLRVYTLNRSRGVASGVTNVTLVNSGNTTIQPTATNAEKGCYLFAALPAGSYTIRVFTNKQDVYLGNNGTYVQRTYQMPTGVLRSTDVTIESPISVSPTFRAYTNAGKTTYQDLDPTSNSGSNNVNPFVKGPQNLGLWIAQSSEIIQAPNSSFFLNPGSVMLPASNSTASDKSLLYPTVAGYSGYAGPCRVNDPGAADWVQVPANPADSTWTPGYNGVVRPLLWLSELKASPALNPVITSQPGSPDTGWGSTEAYYWNQTVVNAQVQTALVGSSAGAATPTNCNSGFALGSDTAAKWQRLPGQITTNNGTLDDVSSALPTGRYDICLRLNFNYTWRNYYGGSIFFGSGKGWQGTAATVNQTAYMKVSGVSIGSKAAPTSTSANFSPANWKAIMSGSASTNSATCGDTAKWS